MDFFVDFQGSKKDVNSLPRIDKILDNLNDMHYFTMLNQANAYWSIPIAPEENGIHKTKVCTTLP